MKPGGLPGNIIPLRPIKGPAASPSMKATTPNMPPAPTHTITGPARRFWTAPETDSLKGFRVTVRKHISSHETGLIPCRLPDGGWCLVPARNLQPLA
jgi:hypothetical protein